MSLAQSILLAGGALMTLFWLAQLFPEPKKGLTIGSIENLIGGVGMTLIGLSAFYDDDYILVGLALLVMGVPLILAYTIEKYTKKRSL